NGAESTDTLDVNPTDPRLTGAAVALVTDDEARVDGVAVLDWADDHETTVAWRVYVPRDGNALPWTPSPRTTAHALHRIQSAALGRSFTVTRTVHIEDDVALWTAPDLPML